MTLRALTIHQPYSWAIFHGKDVKNRRAMLIKSGLLLIHSGQRLHPAKDFTFVTHLADQPMPDLGRPGEPTECAVGAIIGAVQVAGAHRLDACGGTCSPWADRTSPVHIRLTRPRVFRLPIPAYGRQGVWEVSDPQVEAAVRRELAR